MKIGKSYFQVIIYLFIIAVFGFINGQTVFAWEEPTQNPPLGNVPGPVWISPPTAQSGFIDIVSSNTKGLQVIGSGDYGIYGSGRAAGVAGFGSGVTSYGIYGSSDTGYAAGFNGPIVVLPLGATLSGGQEGAMYYQGNSLYFCPKTGGCFGGADWVDLLGAFVVNPSNNEVSLRLPGSTLQPYGNENLYLNSNADVRLRLDKDNNGSNVFAINNGANNTILEVDEAGQMNLGSSLNIGAIGGTNELCLNGSCINSWSQGGGDLDMAYDFGGAGNGRTITADSGAVTINATGDGLEVRSSNSGQTAIYGANTNINAGQGIGVHGYSAVNGGIGVLGQADTADASSMAAQFTGQKVWIGDAGTDNLALGDGSLYIENILETDGSVYLGDGVGGDQVCLNGTGAANCLTSWGNLGWTGGGTGVMYATNTAEQVVAGGTTPITYGAGGWTTRFTVINNNAKGVGIWAQANNVDNGIAGLFEADDGLAVSATTISGKAVSGEATGAGGVAVYGLAAGGAKAGEFVGGLVAVGNSATAGTATGAGDLYVQDTVEIDNSLYVGDNSGTDKICLNGSGLSDCISSWSSVSGNWQAYSSPGDYIQAVAGGIASNSATVYGSLANTHINLGFGNSITGTSGLNYGYATVGGGRDNVAAGPNSVIPGGQFMKVGSGSFGFRGGVGSPAAVLDLSAETNTFHIDSAKFHFNANNENTDFIIDGQSTDNLFYVDSSANRIGIKTNTPAYDVQVVGNLSATQLCIGNDCRNNWPIPTSYWSSGTNGLWYNNKGVIVGTDIGQTLSNPIFSLTAGDLFVKDELGVEGTIYTDAGLAVGTTVTYGSSITRATGGALNVVLGGAVGDDFSVGTTLIPQIFYLKSDTENIGLGTATPNEKLTVSGNLSLAEQGAAPGATANFGKIYIKSADSSKLFFKDESGTEHDLTETGSGYWADGTNGLWYNGEGVIVGDDDMETIDNPAYALNAGDLFVKHEIGVEGLIYTDSGMYVLEKMIYGDTGITRITGGSLNLNLGGAAGDDLKVDTDVLVVESDNNRVGINKAAPTQALDVTGNAAVSGTVSASSFNTTNTQYGSGSVTQSTGSGLSVVLGGAAGDDFSVGTVATPEIFYLKTDTENIGLGTLFPNEKLTISGNLSLVEQAVAPTNTANHGKLYIDSADSSKIWFLDESGTAHDLTATGAGEDDDWDGEGTGTMYAHNTTDVVVIGGNTAASGTALTIDPVSGYSGISLKEQAAAPTNTLNYGKIYIKTADSTNLYFLDEENREHRLTNYWNSGTNGLWYSATGVVVGADAAETIDNAGFVFGASDLFVADQLGVEGNIYTDGAFIAGATLTLSDDYIRDSGNINLQPNNEADDYLQLSSDGTNLTLATVGTANLSITPSGDQLLLQNSVDSTTGLQIFDADGGAPIFNVDTINENVGLSTATPNEKLTVSGNLSLAEQGAAPGATANFGKIYIKSADSSKLFFKDESGTEHDLTATGTGYWADGTNGLWYNDEGVIVGDDIAETIDNPAYALNAGDLFIKHELGIEGMIYTDSGIYVLETMIYGDTGITRITGGSLNLNLGGAAGDDLKVDTDVLVVESDNNRVGINKAAPTQALDVTGNAVVSGTVSGSSFNTTNTQYGNGSVTQSTGSGLLVVLGGAANDNFSVGTTVTPEMLYVKTSTGKVGLGDSAPNEKLTVNGVISLAEQGSAPTNTLNYGKIYIKSADSTNLYFLDEENHEHRLTNYWASGTNGLWYSGSGVIVGADVAETMDNAGFVFGASDLFVADQLGVEGNIYTDGSFIAGTTLTLNDDYIRDSGNINLQPNNDTGDYFVLSSDANDLTLATTDAAKLYVKPAGNQMIFQNAIDNGNGIQFLDADGGTSIVNIDTTNEMVGIGKDVPAFTLDVVGDIAASGNVLTEGSFYATNTIYGDSTIAQATGTSLQLSVGTAVGDDFMIQSGVTPIFIVEGDSSQVGINVADPSYELDVVGDVNGTQLCIAGDCRGAWPAGGEDDDWDGEGTGAMYPTNFASDLIALGTNSALADTTLTIDPIGGLFGGIAIKEQLFAPLNTVDYGKIYIDNADSSKLWFLDESGVAHDLTATGGGGGGGWSGAGTGVMYPTDLTDRVSIGSATGQDYTALSLDKVSFGGGDYGGLAMEEQIGAPLLDANYGLLYIKSADSKLYFVDDSNTEYGLVTWKNAGTGLMYPATSSDKVLIGNTTDTSGAKLVVDGSISRRNNNLYGTNASTHINLGVSSTTGTSGQNYSYSTVSGGIANQAGGGYSFVGGGWLNLAYGTYSLIVGGYDNQNAALAQYGTIVNGYSNYVNDEFGFVGTGWDNSSAYMAAVATGYLNVAGEWSFIGSGQENQTYTNIADFIGTGYSNDIDGGYSGMVTAYDSTLQGNYSIMSGGVSNYLKGNYSFIGSGYTFNMGNVFGRCDYCFIGAGNNNDIYSNATLNYAGVITGLNNLVTTSYSVILGGSNNSAGSGGWAGDAYQLMFGASNSIGGERYSTVLNGSSNSIEWGDYTSIFGGTNNTVGEPFGLAAYDYSQILGGDNNTVNASRSLILGGGNNVIASNDFLDDYDLSFGLGVDITNDDYTVALYDGTNFGKLCVNRDTTDGCSGTSPIQVGTDGTNGNGAYLSVGGVWTDGSSREFKENFSKLDKKAILDKVVNLNIQSWQYKGSATRHIGPVAEDFYVAFGVGDTNKYLAPMDTAGVCLVSVQQLAKQNENLQAQVNGLEQQLKSLEARLKDIEKKLK